MTKTTQNILTDPKSVIVFTYAAAGLGHLRVTNALSQGLPKNTTPILIGSSDKNIEAIHKFISIHVITRRIMEWFQRGRPQKVFTFFYRLQLRSGVSDELLRKFQEIMDQRLDVPERLIIVATHFGLAHKIASFKDRLEKSTGVKVFLAVQVTDDTAQYIWYVPGADVIFVPSNKTRLELLEYGLKSKLPKVRIEVLPYPVSPELAKNLNEKSYADRKSQLEKTTNEHVEFCLPVPGAAVGMQFLEHIIPQLQTWYSKFKFYIVCKDAPFTKNFLSLVTKYPNVDLYTSAHDREIVDAYDRVYHEHTISLEITKPSEQSFKALFDYKAIGGSLLLFSNPVGRQERDNLDFLRRQHLLLSPKENELLWNYSERNLTLTSAQANRIIPADKPIRSLRLPTGSKRAAAFIWWCLKNGVFERMIENYELVQKKDKLEVESIGVELFWEKISELVS